MPCSTTSQLLHFLLQVKDWTAKGMMAQVLRHHMVGCAGLLYNDLTAITNVTSLHGDPIHISYSQVTEHKEAGDRVIKQSALTQLFLKTWMVPLPSLDVQNQIALKEDCHSSWSFQHLAAMQSGLVQPLLWHKLFYPQTLASWAWWQFGKAKGNLLKLKLLFTAKKGWSGLTVSKKFGISLTVPQGATENVVFVAFPELAGFEQWSWNHTQWCCWHKWRYPCHKPNSGSITYAGFSPSEGTCSSPPFSMQGLFHSYC